MGKLLKRRIAATHNLQAELDLRVHRVQDLVSDITTIPTDASGNGTNPALNDSYVGANEFKRTFVQELTKYSDIVNDTTTGGANVPASAEAVKTLQLQIDSMANGLEYIGTFDASAGTWPSNVTQGNFFKVSVAGTISGVKLTVGDMIIANKIVSGATTVSDWDIIDNTESPDLIRDADISDNVNMSVDTTKIPTRGAVNDFVNSQIAAVSIKVMVESLIIDSQQKFTLSHTPVSGVVFNNEAIIEVDVVNGIYDTWEGIQISGNVASIVGTSAPTDYVGLAAKVTYLYI